MLSQLPTNMDGLTPSQKDKEILRLGIIAELDAINLYEQLAAAATDETIKKILVDIAKEEKTHVGEFETMLLRLDEEQVEEFEKGKEEVEEMME
jgi:rubrerythrin